MLRFVFGASGAGKSYHIRREIIDRSIREPERNFLVVVPDQFTMQTQLDMVRQHPRGGIMNIDVVSFSRLSHRIFEEVGESHDRVLDDMGKSLVLRHVAENIRDELPVIGGSMHKMGYIDEVKSTISEFMQYSIEPEMLGSLIDACGSKGALRSKLEDLRLLYSEFKKYIRGNYIASEELMEVLCRAIPGSELIKDSVIAFDGFTGFTPVQYKVIGALLERSSEVIFSFSIGQEDNPYVYKKDSQQELFLLTKKTVHDLLRIEYENEKMIDPLMVPDFDRWAEHRNAVHGAYGRSSDGAGDILIEAGEKSRHANNPELSFLEQHLFRYGNAGYGAMAKGEGDGGSAGEESCSRIRILEADTVSEEVQMVLSRIRSLIREDSSLHYRDFAMVCGNLERYEATISREALKYEVPVYLDQTGSIGLNPLIETLRSALLVITSSYSYESVFHYLRSGLSGMTYDEVDMLENYVRALGVRGRKAWEQPFERLTRQITRKLNMTELSDAENDTIQKEKEQYLNKINELRERTVSVLAPLFEVSGGTVLDFSRALYEFLLRIEAQQQIAEYEKTFHEQGDEIRAKEYGVIYRKVISLLDQVAELMSDEKLSWKEYADILEVGFGDIEIGTIPQSVDRIVVGDIERTRLKEVKVLFFLGVNDDLIPKSAGTGGIISDIERQFLADTLTDIELAPTPRQQMYIQRLYLYMNLTKPSDRLYLSCAHIDPSGKSIRPAYLISKIKSMFPAAVTDRYDRSADGSIIQSAQNGMDYVSAHIMEYANGYMDADAEKVFLGLFRALMGDANNDRLSTMITAAGTGYIHKPLSDAVAAALYGNYLMNSVSRLEKLAQCSYAHFLQFGLRLYEREEFSFESSDLGTVYHGVLEIFFKKLGERGLTWNDFTPEQGEQILDEALTEYAKNYNGNILESSKRNEYLMNRIRRILLRSVDTLQYQLKKGDFVPKSVETSFDAVGDIDAINIALTRDEKGRILNRMKLTGKIDRIDTYEDEDHVYLKIVDFKSGNKDFDLCALYYGLQLQLVMYMNVARGMAEAEKTGKKVVPAGVLYYHLTDPVIEGAGLPEENRDEAINAGIRKALKTKGVIQENPEVAMLFDRDITLGEASDVVPIKLKKEGGFSKNGSDVMSADDFDTVSDYVSHLIKKSGQRIMSGDIDVNPYEMGDRSACKYCSYKSVCGFDKAVPGYGMRELEKKKDDEIMELIRDELRGEE